MINEDVSSAEEGMFQAHTVGSSRRGATGGLEAEPQGRRAPSKWINVVLDEHNKRRIAHWTPALMWNDECYDYAKMQAEACVERGMAVGGYCDGLSGMHGQCIAGPFGTEEYGKLLQGTPTDAERVVARWYAEGSLHDYENPEARPETRNFAQVMWFTTTSVGMALSSDGQYCVANYFQRGLDPTLYARNIRPKRDGLPPWRPPCEGAFLEWRAQWEEFERQVQAEEARMAAEANPCKKKGKQAATKNKASSPAVQPAAAKASAAKASPSAKRGARGNSSSGRSPSVKKRG